MFQFDLYMLLIVIGVMVFATFWCVILWKSIRIALDNRKVKAGLAVAEPDQEPVLFRTTRSWIMFSPILSYFSATQFIIGQCALLFFRQGLGGLQAAAFALYSGICIILQWLYFEITTLSVTKSRVILRKGLFVEHRVIILISEITDIETVSSKGIVKIIGKSKKEELTMRAIPFPEEIKDFIEQLKKESENLKSSNM